MFFCQDYRTDYHHKKLTENGSKSTLLYSKQLQQFKKIPLFTEKVIKFFGNNRYKIYAPAVRCL